MYKACQIYPVYPVFLPAKSAWAPYDVPDPVRKPPNYLSGITL